MLSTLFKIKPVIDESTKTWIFDTFAWCIAQFDGEPFRYKSKLILPNESFYPRSSCGVELMAENIFANTMKYTGMSAWPIKIAPEERLSQQNYQNNSTNISEVTSPLNVTYQVNQLNHLPSFIAYSVRQQVAILLNHHAPNAPGGCEVLGKTIDLVACFMGFGIIFANTVNLYEKGDEIGSTPNQQKILQQTALSELETVYALALFCAIKNSDIKMVKSELNSHLYKTFIKAYKEISLYLQQTDNPIHMLQRVNTPAYI